MLGSRPRIGIIGGGQLAKMTAMAALRLGCEISILEKEQNSLVANLSTDVMYGDWDQPDTLMRLAERVDVVALENEFVDAGGLQAIEDAGFIVYPSASTIAQVQDKLVQKQTLAAAGIPLAPFAPVASKQDIIKYADSLGFPLVLKARRNGYDGKGNATIHTLADIDLAWDKLGGDSRSLYVEQFCHFEAELAVMIVRGRGGEIVHYPIVKSVQVDHICHTVLAPAQMDVAIINEALDIAQKAVITINAVGAVGVEMFLTTDNRILLNEMAPRVHNSGHYTIEACACSQFENHVRAILGLPLGSTEMVAPAAVMVNLLAQAQGSGWPRGLEQALAVQGAYVHIYGKKISRVGRKMGHVTALGETHEGAERLARKAAESLQFGAE